MRVSKEKAAENRERILAEAARLFRERGISGVGVDTLTDAAGLTHGSLYSQFGSKERLAAEALGHALSTSSARMNDTGTLDDYVARYLSADHRDRRGDGCAGSARVFSLLATTVRVVCSVIAALIVIHAVFVLFEANPANPLVSSRPAGGTPSAGSPRTCSRRRTRRSPRPSTTVSPPSSGSSRAPCCRS